jgi:hypothetical protein
VGGNSFQANFSPAPSPSSHEKVREGSISTNKGQVVVSYEIVGSARGVVERSV